MFSVQHKPWQGSLRIVARSNLPQSVVGICVNTVSRRDNAPGISVDTISSQFRILACFWQ